MLVAICISILLKWTVCAVVVIGIGSSVLRPFHQEYFLTDAFWIGLGMSVGILEIYHLLHAIDLFMTLLLACSGLFGLILNRRWLFRQAWSAGRIGVWPIIAYLAIVVSLALHASGPNAYSYDTGLYGAGAVRWIITYPAVPGLANLHYRLGFTSAVFLCAGALDQGFWRDQSHYLFSGLLISALLASFLPAYVRLFRGTSTSAVDWFQSILLIPVGVWTIRGTIVGADTDLPTTAVCFAAFAILFRELDAGRATGDGVGKSNLGSVVAAVLFALGAAFKLSAVVLTFLGWIVVLVRLRVSALARRERRFLIAACLALPAAILLPWVGRNLILSGYPFYPNTSFAAPVDWRVPAVAADFMVLCVRSWGRNPYARRLADTQGFSWVKPWLRGALINREGFQIPLVLFWGGALVVIFAFLRQKPLRLSRVLWLLVPSVAGSLFWFVASPDPRFGEAALWTSAATLGTLAIVSALNKTSLRWRRIALVGLLVTTWWCAGVRNLWRSYRPLSGIREFVPLPVAKLVKRQTLSGLTVYLPAEGDQCWDAMLPCAPYFNKTLRLRSQNGLRWGFVSQGLAEGLSDYLPPTRH